MAFSVVALLSLLFLVSTKINFSGNLEGLYLLKGMDGNWFEMKDDIYLGEYERMLFKLEVGRIFSSPRRTLSVDGSNMQYKWHKRTGDGYIMNSFPDGTKLVISFGRFVDSEGQAPNGIFLGGGLPYSAYQDEIVTMNETGMAFFNGKKWLHLWCSANESIISSLSTGRPLAPSHWEFLGSEILYDHLGELLLKSSHALQLSGTPMTMDRFALYRSGDLFFTLVIKIKNIGQRPVAYNYIYGDEPWVGNYGSSFGNIGWTKERLYYYESKVDAEKNSFAGMVELGNSVLPSEREEVFSGTGNFIQWLGEVRPRLIYLANQSGRFAEESQKVPLDSPDNRVLFLQWGPRFLEPGQSDAIMLSIGMAEKDPKTGLPIKPNLRLDKDYLDFIINHRELE